MRFKTLLAALAISAACVPADAADSYFYRAKPAAIAALADVAPDAFSFTAVTGANPASVVTSNRVALTGHTGVTASVSGDPTAQVRVCSDASCTTATAWGSGPIAVPADKPETRSWLEARVTTGTAGSPAKVVKVAVGTGASDWSVAAKASLIAETTANLPAGWVAEYVPISSAIGNANHATGARNVSLLRDGDISTPAWSYPVGSLFNGLTIAQHNFAENLLATKCYFAWRNDTASTVTMNLQLGGNDNPTTTIVSKPGVNTYNGSCLYTIAWSSVYLTVTNAQNTGINVTEFKIGR